MSKNVLYIIVGLVTIIFCIGVWFLFFRTSTSTPATTPISDLFGTPANNTTNVTTGSTNTNNTQPIASSGQVSTQKVFEITEGPVVGATLIQTLHPTTTLARYVSQNDGHVYDLPLDVPGAVPRIVSNVTIPGAYRTLWLEHGNAVLLQYIDKGAVKSVYLGLPTATSSSQLTAARIQFLPDNIVDIAASPDGTNLVYLLKTSSGSDGYVAKSDGTGAKKLFSLPLSQMLVTWPSQGTFLAQSKSAAGVAGIVFSVDTKTGTIAPLIYANGITANANSSFAYMIYQAIQNNTSIIRSTYVRNIKDGTDSSLSFSPIPEKCIWSMQNSSFMYCAFPLSYIPVNYLDLWHQGSASNADALFLFNLVAGTSTIITSPGSSDGGVASDILEMALSPNEKYLSFTTKGLRTLWGVRLSN